MGPARGRRSGVCGPPIASTAVPRRVPGERAVRTAARVRQVDAAGVRRVTPPARRQVLVDLERHGDGGRVLPPGVVEDETDAMSGPMQRRRRHDALPARSGTWGARPRRGQPWSSGRIGGMSRTYVRRTTVASARTREPHVVRPNRIRRPCADCVDDDVLQRSAHVRARSVETPADDPSRDQPLLVDGLCPLRPRRCISDAASSVMIASTPRDNANSMSRGWFTTHTWTCRPARCSRPTSPGA